jgi:type II secretory pathway pseudopilin PulG
MIHRTGGFSIVEALVATMLVGVASTLLAAALTVRTAARRQSARDAVAAHALSDVLSTLARRPCTAADTAAESALETAAGTARVRWAALRSRAGWSFTETLFVAAPGRRTVVATQGRVPCT